jgi:gluconolactonase
MTASQPRVIAKGLGFLEGPVALIDGRVLVTDVGDGKILVIDPQSGAVNTWADTRGGPNGLAFGPDGALYVANDGGMKFAKNDEGFNYPVADGSRPDHATEPAVQRIAADGTITDLYTKCDGHPFTHLNDIVFDAHGGFYITDTGHVEGRHTDLGGMYYGKADGSGIRELVHNSAPATPLTQPNGVALSPDGTRVYAAETVTGRIWAWDVTGPGEIATADDFLGGAMFIYGESGRAMFDSFAVDSAGNICVATLMAGVITVISPSGELVERVELPKFDPFITNICFGGEDLRTAYITAGATGSLWELEWARPGLRLNYNF